jgi:hypothetical protein
MVVVVRGRSVDAGDRLISTRRAETRPARRRASCAGRSARAALRQMRRPLGRRRWRASRRGRGMTAADSGVGTLTGAAGAGQVRLLHLGPCAAARWLVRCALALRLALALLGRCATASLRRCICHAAAACSASALRGDAGLASRAVPGAGGVRVARALPAAQSSAGKTRLWRHGQESSLVSADIPAAHAPGHPAKPCGASLLLVQPASLAMLCIFPACASVLGRTQSSVCYPRPGGSLSEELRREEVSDAVRWTAAEREAKARQLGPPSRRRPSGAGT